MKVNSVHFTTIESTNRWAMVNANTLDPAAMTVITADEQTAGYGRQGRRWASPRGDNLYATFCLFLPEAYPMLTFVMALSVAKVLKGHGLVPEIKWPNDLLIDKKKIGGILCESKKIDSMHFMAIGVGLNVNMTKDMLEGIDRPATSLLMETGKAHGIESVKQSLIDPFIFYSNILLQEGFDSFVEPIRSMMKTGKTVRFHQGNIIVEGVLDSFNADGSITLTLTDGTQRRFVSGEILD
jgi:BirA family biotin operon repressor/biotin-[acetyl-CoA-carboxylase] ligase